jgi:hypothetical protein
MKSGLSIIYSHCLGHGLIYSLRELHFEARIRPAIFFIAVCCQCFFGFVTVLQLLFPAVAAAAVAPPKGGEVTSLPGWTGALRSRMYNKTSQKESWPGLNKSLYMKNWLGPGWTLAGRWPVDKVL